jgi:hypothetical protein
MQRIIIASKLCKGNDVILRKTEFVFVGVTDRELHILMSDLVNERFSECQVIVGLRLRRESLFCAFETHL